MLTLVIPSLWRINLNGNGKTYFRLNAKVVKRFDSVEVVEGDEGFTMKGKGNKGLKVLVKFVGPDRCDPLLLHYRRRMRHVGPVLVWSRTTSKLPVTATEVGFRRPKAIDNSHWL